MSNKNIRLCALLIAVALPLVFIGCDAVQSPGADLALVTPADAAARGRIVVANRASASLSVIDTQTDAVTTVPMPDGGEPMYAVYTPARHRVFVGDRANSQVVAFDARTFEVVGTVPAGEGVFHMWADPQSKQLWVVDNIGDALTVIDPTRLEVITTVPVEGGTPHDVVVGPRGRYAYVSVFADEGPDQVVMYSTATFEDVDRADVGDDPHLSVNKQDGMLYVAAQGADTVFVLDLETLGGVAAPAVPNAHGAGMARNGKVFYTTNISGGGADGVFALDTQTHAVLGAADTAFPTPHNLALTPDARKLYVTHSGATADQVSVCTMSRQDPVPECDASVTVGLNPFGLTYVP